MAKCTIDNDACMCTFDMDTLPNIGRGKGQLGHALELMQFAARLFTNVT